ncbi:hypothetical protein [Streptomyces sp. NPDC004267]|uniref:hypothetical protein n=1 Tax=Streptomyces sp. NPDC004267 TaxID=3364694 RepID=UPI00368B00AC
MKVVEDFELLDVSLYAEGLGRLGVPLRGTAETEPLEVPEGTVISVGITFRLGRDIDTVIFEDVRERGGELLGTTRTVLGGFRAGGPYEVRLPPERLPVGRAHCGVYEMTGHFTDGEGRRLAVEHHWMRLTHQSAAPRPRAARHAVGARPAAAGSWHPPAGSPAGAPGGAPAGTPAGAPAGTATGAPAGTATGAPAGTPAASPTGSSGRHGRPAQAG